MTVKFPDSSTLETSLLKAIKANGGIARTDEIDKFVSEDLKLSAVLACNYSASTA
jgi:hypothetical protein